MTPGTGIDPDTGRMWPAAQERNLTTADVTDERPTGETTTLPKYIALSAGPDSEPRVGVAPTDDFERRYHR